VIAGDPGHSGTEGGQSADHHAAGANTRAPVASGLNPRSTWKCCPVSGTSDTGLLYRGHQYVIVTHLRRASLASVSLLSNVIRSCVVYELMSRRPRTAPTVSLPRPAPIAAAEYDPATVTYIGPDGHTYTQCQIWLKWAKAPTWQQMPIPPTGN
jgi:hypothetical protein